MAKINRVNGNVQAFASAALGTERTVFGDVAQSDDLTAQFTADFLRGWGIVGASDQPALEDFNGAMYTHGQLLAYLHQVGVPEYNAAQEYHIGSITNSGSSLYVSRTNNNTGNTPLTSPANWRNIDAAPANTGAAVNLRSTLPSAGVLSTFSADEIIVKRSLGGASYALSSVGIGLNLGITGPGGMDAGTAPANGYIAVYVIYNPTTGAINSLATNATLSVMPEIYGAAPLPAGFVASALLTVIPTNAGAQMKAYRVNGRQVNIQLASVFTSAVGIPPTVVSIATAVPRNAIEIFGELQLAVDAAASMSLTVTSDASGVGQQNVSLVTTAGGGTTGNYSNVPVITTQSVTVQASTTAGTPAFTLYVGGYKI